MENMEPMKIAWVVKPASSSAWSRPSSGHRRRRRFARPKPAATSTVRNAAAHGWNGNLQGDREGPTEIDEPPPRGRRSLAFDRPVGQRLVERAAIACRQRQPGARAA
jgi:hypothetical protein